MASETEPIVILNVDDNEAKRYGVSRILERSGYSVIEAETGSEALEKAASLPNLIILDVRLPDINGFEVCQTLKAQASTSSIPVLHLSASFTESADKALGLNLGADGYLTHPIEPHVLVATVRSLIRLHQAEAAARASAARLEQAYKEQKRIAETLQRSLLINVAEDAFPGIKMATFYEAAWEEASVGGDFYDTYRVTGGQIALIVGDAAGKGLVAATRTAEVKFALRAFMHEHADPAEAMQRLNRFLCDSHSGDDDMNNVIALALGLIDQSNGTVTFCTAGAEPAVIFKAALVTEVVHTRGLPLGVSATAEYAQTIVNIEPGDTIIMATDGIYQARNGRDFLWLEGMLEIAKQHLGKHDGVRAAGRAILDDARAYARGKFQDDVCMLIARLDTP